MSPPKGRFKSTATRKPGDDCASGVLMCDFGATVEGPTYVTCLEGPTAHPSRDEAARPREDTSVAVGTRSRPPVLHICFLNCLTNLVFDHVLLMLIKICPT